MIVDLNDLSLSSYDYRLDHSYIAQKPIEPRHDARLMIVSSFMPEINSITHSKVWDLIDEINPRDLLVMNNTRVLKARLRVRLANGARAELLLLEPYLNGEWLCLAKPARKMRPGDSVWLEAPNQETIHLEIIEKDLKTGGRVVKFPSHFFNRESIENFLELYGEVPLPPYIHSNGINSHADYQTTYAECPGAVAAPTAGLHLSDEVLEALNKKGVEQAMVTLHVGLGTFRPLEIDDLTNLELHSEWVEVRQEVVSAIEKCHCRGGNVFAIGTTTVRALEASFLAGHRRLKPFKGPVDLVIKPGYQFGVVDGLLTNFHLPKSSLLLLVSALIGRKKLMTLYKTAIDCNYRFYSYGDAMLIKPKALLPSARYQEEDGS